MFNSLVMSLNGTTYVFECHSWNKAVEIIASHHQYWTERDEDFPNVDYVELV